MATSILNSVRERTETATEDKVCLAVLDFRTGIKGPGPNNSLRLAAGNMQEPIQARVTGS